MALARGAGFVLAFALLAAGCVLPEVKLVTEAEVCTACAESKCAAEHGSCYAQEACETLVDCALDDCAPGDTECAIACWNDSPDGQDAATALAECALSACPDECGSLLPF